MRIPTRTTVTACALSAVLLAAGCAGTGVKQTRVGEPVYLQTAVDRGPDPFTDSTAVATPRPESPRVTARVQSGDAEAPMRAARTLSGTTPGLYRGTPRVAGCDVERHIRYLEADEDRAEAFADAAHVGRAALPGYLRGLTPVVLGADTRVTNHAYRDRRPARYQAVLQAGTAVLVDDRGVPRVRCACGNPLDTPTPTRGGAAARGAPWSGYQPNQVVVVTPAPRAVTTITLVDAETRTWIERRVGPDVRQDHVVTPPVGAAISPTAPEPSDRAESGERATASPSPLPPSARESRSAADPGRTGTPSFPAAPAAPDPRTDAPDGATGLTGRNTGPAGQEPPPSADPPADPPAHPPDPTADPPARDPDPTADPPARDPDPTAGLLGRDPGPFDPATDPPGRHPGRADPTERSPAPTADRPDPAAESSDPDAESSGPETEQPGPETEQPGPVESPGPALVMPDPDGVQPDPDGVPPDLHAEPPGPAADTSGETGPPRVPESPDLPDGGGLIPDDAVASPAATTPDPPALRGTTTPGPPALRGTTTPDPFAPGAAPFSPTA
ncbi:DUF6777 domain-containing protein [Streptomyces naphthomycinicus]|uniref:DUF6777 domain-containing protein n=1 Tax=Streptomyces naphthomycinicus TaxID=2872625 RepID=UPI001CEC584B|nr:DUF6777 domain-containing protein [Streptomyces sp. TML10]